MRTPAHQTIHKYNGYEANHIRYSRQALQDKTIYSIDYPTRHVLYQYRKQHFY